VGKKEEGKKAFYESLPGSRGPANNADHRNRFIDLPKQGQIFCSSYSTACGGRHRVMGRGQRARKAGISGIPVWLAGGCI